MPGGSFAGNALVLGTAVAQAFQIALMERYAPRYDARALTCIQMAVSCLGFTAVALSLGQLRLPHGGVVWYAILVTGVFAGALGYLVATWIQARTTAARAALAFTLEAPFAALFGVLLDRRPARVDRLDGLCGDPRRDRARRAGWADHARSPGAPAGGRVTAVLLALASAALFGDDDASRCGSASAVSRRSTATLATLIPALAVALVAAGIHHDLHGTWPFLLAGLLAPGVSQILFTRAVREVGASRTSVTLGAAPLVAVAIAVVFLGEPLGVPLAVGALGRGRRRGAARRRARPAGPPARRSGSPSPPGRPRSSRFATTSSAICMPMRTR